MRDTKEEIESTNLGDSAKQEDASTDPKKHLLRKPTTRAGKMLSAIVVAAITVGGAYAVVVFAPHPMTQTGPGVPVQDVAVGCTVLSVTPVSVLVGDGGGDVKFYCGNGSPALTTVNGTATLVVTGVASSDVEIPQGTYSPAFFLIPYGYAGPFGSEHSCSGIPGLWGGVDDKHFGYPLTIGTGTWDYCLEYINQTSAGGLNPITVTWTPVADWD